MPVFIPPLCTYAAMAVPGLLVVGAGLGNIIGWIIDQKVDPIPSPAASFLTERPMIVMVVLSVLAAVLFVAADFYLSTRVVNNVQTTEDHDRRQQERAASIKENILSSRSMSLRDSVKSMSRQYDALDSMPSYADKIPMDRN